MPSRRAKLFAELGLLAEDQPVNPYGVLGLDLDAAHALLREDASGGALRDVTRALFRVFSRRYHPDNSDTGNEERFKAVTEAQQRITDASDAALLRWAKAEGTASSTQLNKLQAQRKEIAERAAALLRQNMDLGHHPHHFLQLEWAQGLLLQRNDTAILLREQQNGGLEIRRGETPGFNKSPTKPTTSSQITDFKHFLWVQRSFGLQPNTNIHTYIDESGRASVLDEDLRFLIDISDPVAAYRKHRARKVIRTDDRWDPSDFWSRSPYPLLLATHTPATSTDSAMDSSGEVIHFPDWAGLKTTGKRMAWDLPMEVAGTCSDNMLFERTKHNRIIGAIAVTGGSARKTTNLFGMAPVPLAHFIQQDLGYSPLITPGNSLLLYDTANRTPLITDTQVVGMLGSSAQAAWRHTSAE
ncbi:MAG TPA: hypothetical protein VJP80_02030 [Candidatus Saccharimonadales bacterium]|nr:hypothetical protein [Candidatus Saccharimonadales bacterium]